GSRPPSPRPGAAALSGPPALRGWKDGGGEAGDVDLSLEDILRLYNQPINEEQAWAVCYQCCRTLVKKRRGRSGSDAGSGASSSAALHRIAGPGDVRIQRDGSVRVEHQGSPIAVIESLGIMIYKALDYGLKENEERELSPPLEQLIDLMTNMGEAEKDACPDEGYEATEEEDEAEDDPDNISGGHGYSGIFRLCTSHLPCVSDAPSHYQAVCRALFTETRELRTFLEKIKSAKENLRKMEASSEEAGRDLDELQNADWARFWVQVMRDLRDGVKLKKVQERQYNPLPIEFQLTPYEMLMDDIRSKRYKLRKVMVNGDIPPRLKKSAHEVILEFIRSRPPLNPVSARKLKPQAQAPPTLHERILEEIKAERKLRPVSPDVVRRGRLGKKLIYPLLYHGTKANVTLHKTHICIIGQLILSELNDEFFGHKSPSSSSVATSLMDDTSPESTLGKKTPPTMFLPISSTPQPERRQTPQRRHSIEKEKPTNVRQFQPPSKKSSKSLEEFSFPVECLSLTVEEVMHIRQVLVKAELEKFQHNKDVYNAMKKGKLCFCCRTKRFSLFTWSYICQFCKKPVCSQCCKKVQLAHSAYLGCTHGWTDPKWAGPVSHLSLHTLCWCHSLFTVLSPPCRLSKHGSLKSHEELELPSELTEDWECMEVCVECKKFISDIVASSKHSLSLATKRARLKCKTQSFYMSSPKGREEYRPSERTIKEI
uniref:KIND domain-containing protein n=1 Tax=Gouania willdenowi TaxID=441366 RepID=A0A8C5D9H0_GOUWI